MHDFHRLNSTEDASINWVLPAPSGLFFETRLVERENGHFIIYVSSQSGCVQKCRFCHLTQTGQTREIMNASPADLGEQLEYSLRGLAEARAAGKRVNRISISFMARGEPLDRPHFVDDFEAFSGRVAPYILSHLGFSGTPVTYKISTIFPVELASSFEGVLATLGDMPNTKLYWSLYSLESPFRRKWLPNASDPHLLAHILRPFYKSTGRLIIHSAWIDGENDSEAQATALADFLGKNFGGVRFNHVAYNPYYRGQGSVGKESPPEIIERNNNILKKHGMLVKSIKRVGHDVKASCGMFFSSSKGKD